MKITGHRLREAIKEWELRRDGAVESFDGTLSKFDDEEKESPGQVMTDIANFEKAIARLQTVQTAYNLAISVDLGTEKISLAEAVKRVGGYEKIERMWRNAMRQVAPGRSAIRHRLLAAQGVAQEEPKATINQTQAREATSQAAKAANKLRSAIAVANATEIDVTDLDPTLVP